MVRIVTMDELVDTLTVLEADRKVFVKFEGSDGPMCALELFLIELNATLCREDRFWEQIRETRKVDCKGAGLIQATDRGDDA